MDKKNIIIKNRKPQKQIYKLYGVVSSIDKKHVIMGGHIDTIEKLKLYGQHKGKNPLLPSNKFYADITNIYMPDVKGEKIIIWAYMRKYSFKSNYDFNKGESIRGWKLKAVKFEKNNDWK